jgi:glutamate synthase domain-containing protein 2
MRACHTNNCPVGIATQKKDLRARLIVEESARRLRNFLTASVELMQVLARACGHAHLRDFSTSDLTTWKRDIADLTGISFAGTSPS